MSQNLSRILIFFLSICKAMFAYFASKGTYLLPDTQKLTFYLSFYCYFASKVFLNRDVNFIHDNFDN